MNSDVFFRAGTENWDKIRATPEGLRLLTSGSGFLITKTAFDQWNAILTSTPEPASIHCYLYIENDELCFLLVDSVSDAQERYVLNETVFIQSYTIIPPIINLNPDYIPQIAFRGNEYITRIMRWLFYAHLWHGIKISGGPGPVRVFAIPFTDLQQLFALHEPLESVSVFIGLKEFDGRADATDVELILCNEVANADPNQGTIKEFCGDLTSPCPPFCGDGKFNLL